MFKTTAIATFIAIPAVLLTLTTATALDVKTINYPIPNGAYFVSPAGRDGNSGRTPDSPWTVAKALSDAPSGATIVFRGGQYRNVNTTIRKRFTLQPYLNEKAWLKGSDIVTGWVREGRIWRKDGWNYSFPQNVGNEYIERQYPLAGRRDMVYVNGVALKQVGSKKAVSDGRFYVDAANNKLYIGTNPSSKTVEATTLTKAFTLWRSKNSNPSNTVIRGLGFAHYADEALLIGTPRVTLENNIFAWNGQRGVAIFAPDGVVRGNTFKYNGRLGLFGMSTHRSRLENNIIDNNNVENFRKNWDAAGVKIIHTDGAVVRDNVVASNNSTGIWIDNSSTNTTVVNNSVHNNDGNGILFEVSHKAIIASNLAYQNARAGIMVYNASDARIYNNTLAQNHANLIIQDTSRNNTKRNEIAKGITWVTRNNVVKNNIFWNSSEAAMFFAPSCTTKVTSNQMISAIDHNAYYRRSSNPPNTHRWSFGRKRCSVAFGSLDAFRAATGKEQNSTEVVSSSDPFFVSAASGDYRLKLGSPASRRGDALPPDIAAAIGVAPGIVDIGALVF